MTTTATDVWTKVQVKLFADTPGETLEVAPFVRVFHDWVKHQSLGELLIDVVDYSHVHRGPAAVLIGHGSDYIIDFAEGQPGLLYSRKRAGADTADGRLEDALRRAVGACLRLAQDDRIQPRVAFRTDRIVFRAPDRLTASPDAFSFERHALAVRALLVRVVGQTPVELSRGADEREPLTVVARLERPPSFAILAESLGV